MTTVRVGSGWHPNHALPKWRLRDSAGRLLAFEHAVWRIIKIRYPELTEEQRDEWVRIGMPDLDEWSGRPYTVILSFVAGARPAEFPESGPEGARYRLNVPMNDCRLWSVYPESDRWPQCSCCGEPMPCRAEMADRDVEASRKRLERMESVLPGCCWACREPITSRQQAVTYPGDNLDLPGSPAPRFHLRRACRGSAEHYELRWLEVDPRRERILTYPTCPGYLIVHHDGSSECIAGRAPLSGKVYEPVPDCRGHLTHDHGCVSACFAHYGANGCPRGCSPVGHPGCRHTPRPQRRDMSTLEGL